MHAQVQVQVHTPAHVLAQVHAQSRAHEIEIAAPSENPRTSISRSTGGVHDKKGHR